MEVRLMRKKVRVVCMRCGYEWYSSSKLPVCPVCKKIVKKTKVEKKEKRERGRW
jgi:rubrerythrin